MKKKAIIWGTVVLLSACLFTASGCQSLWKKKPDPKPQTVGEFLRQPRPSDVNK